MRSTGFGRWERMGTAAGTSSSTCTREQHHGQAGGYAPSALEIDDPQFGHA
jgi:hypothetical protein